jgi:hypothetical protein
MADIVKPEALPPTHRREDNKRPKRSKAAKHLKWSASKTGTLSMPLVAKLMRTLGTAPVLKGRSCIMEAGVLAFRREAGDGTRVLLISKKRTGNWGYPQRRGIPAAQFCRDGGEGGIRGGWSCRLYLT